MSEVHLPHQHSDEGTMRELQESVETIGSFQTVADVFKQLSDSSRVRIFWLLCHCEECVIDLSAMVGMSSPAVSHHLRQLRESGLLVSRRVGKEVYYRAADTEESRLLHEIVERVMEIACPEKTVDFQASQEEIVRRVFLVRIKTNEEIKRQRVAKVTGEGAGGDKTVKRQPVVKKIKVGPNDPCPCGSGKKYKKCCRDKDLAAERGQNAN